MYSSAVVHLGSSFETDLCIVAVQPVYLDLVLIISTTISLTDPLRASAQPRQVQNPLLVHASLDTTAVSHR